MAQCLSEFCYLFVTVAWVCLYSVAFPGHVLLAIFLLAVSPTLANCRKCSKTSFKSHADVFSGARDVYAIHELYMRAAKAQPSVRNA